MGEKRRDSWSFYSSFLCYFFAVAAIWILWAASLIGSVVLLKFLSESNANIFLELLSTGLAVIIGFHFFVLVVISEDILKIDNVWKFLLSVFDKPRIRRKRQKLLRSSKVLQGACFGDFSDHDIEFGEKVIENSNNIVTVKLFADICSHTPSKGWERVRVPYFGEHDLEEKVTVDTNTHDWMEKLVEEKQTFRYKGSKELKSYKRFVEKDKLDKEIQKGENALSQKIIKEETRVKQRAEEIVLQVLSKS